MIAGGGVSGWVTPECRNRDKNLLSLWRECVCGDCGQPGTSSRCANSHDFKPLHSKVRVATFNRDKNLIKSPRAGLSGFPWVTGAVTTNRDKYLAGLRVGLALGRM